MLMPGDRAYILTMPDIKIRYDYIHAWDERMLYMLQYNPYGIGQMLKAFTTTANAVVRDNELMEDETRCVLRLDVPRELCDKNEIQLLMLHDIEKTEPFTTALAYEGAYNGLTIQDRNIACLGQVVVRGQPEYNEWMATVMVVSSSKDELIQFVHMKARNLYALIDDRCDWQKYDATKAAKRYISNTCMAVHTM